MRVGFVDEAAAKHIYLCPGRTRRKPFVNSFQAHLVVLMEFGDHAASGTLHQANADNFISIFVLVLLDHLVRDEVVFRISIGTGVVARSNLDCNVVYAHAFHRGTDHTGHSIAYGRNRDHRTNTDDNAQHGEQGAHLIGDQARDSEGNIFKQIHAAPPAFRCACRVPERSGRRGW